MTDRSQPSGGTKHAAAGARALVGALAAAAGVLLVGAMAVAGQASAVPPVQEASRLVVVLSDQDIESGSTPNPVAPAVVPLAETGGS